MGCALQWEKWLQWENLLLFNKYTFCKDKKEESKNKKPSEIEQCKNVCSYLKNKKDTEREKERERERYRQTDRQRHTDRQTDRDTEERERDIQTDRQRHTHAHTALKKRRSISSESQTVLSTVSHDGFFIGR